METSTGAEYISQAHVRHIMRYVQARDWLNGIEYIADAACGTGYGTKVLSSHKIIGVDFDSDALLEARKTYDNISFYQHDLRERYGCMRLVNQHAFVSIETIEHFSKDDGAIVLSNFNEWLIPNGILIISTPYCTHTGPSPITTQHLCEYSLTDFEQLLNDAGFAIELMKLERHEGQAGRLGYCMAKCRKK